MAKNKNRREQAPKAGRNEAWARANMELAKRNNTVPARKGKGAPYKRKDKYVRWE